MNNNFIEIFKTNIEDEIEEVKIVIEELKERAQPIEPDCSIGRVSRIDAINNKTVVDHNLIESKAKLMRLELRLSKYGSHDFLKCSDCNEEIDHNRLLFIPDALKCIKCAN